MKEVRSNSLLLGKYPNMIIIYGIDVVEEHENTIIPFVSDILSAESISLERN